MRVELTPAELIELIQQGVAAIMSADPKTISAILTRMEGKMAEIDDRLAAQTAATNEMKAAVAEVATDLMAEHAMLVDALAKLAAGTGPTAAQLAAIQANTDAMGEMTARLRQVVADTPNQVTPGAPVIT